jgi:hypothetical protein
MSRNSDQTQPQLISPSFTPGKLQHRITFNNGVTEGGSANPKTRGILMKSTRFLAMSASIAGLALATMFVPYAHAGCGLYSPLPHGASWQPQIAAPRLIQAAPVIDDGDATKAEPSIVGTWKEHWISEGSEGIKDGTEVDAGYAQCKVTAMRSIFLGCVLH